MTYLKLWRSGAFWIVLLIGLAACDPAEPVVQIPPLEPATIVVLDPTVAPTEPVDPTVTPAPTPTLPAPAVDPTVPPPAGPATFSNLTFKEQPGLATATTAFVDPNEVYAVWQYANMRSGDVTRRDWYHNGSLFISREEIWDAAVYGSEGIRTDVSLYDFENGLEPGVYLVVLSINNQVQVESTFEVETTPVVTSPDPVETAAITGLRFSLDPSDDRYFVSFEDASEVFAIFDYENMESGDVLKRDWYLNGRSFASREEAWDSSVYGEDGTRNDISIFDFEDGLAVGSYRVVFSINGDKQIERRFWINEPGGHHEPAQYRISTFSKDKDDPFGDYVFEEAEEIFVTINYKDMADGDVVTREWFFNETPLITREEPWDFAKYGQSGMHNDISIFDFEDGLAYGEYRLLVSLNGEFQHDHSFEVRPLELISPILEPISGRTAETVNRQTLVVTNPDGSTRSFTANGRIIHLDWFSGGEKLAYTNQVVVDPKSIPAFGLGHEVYIVNLTDGSTSRLTTLEENIHHPLVSPDGRSIALLQGSGYGDACYIGLSLVIIEINELGEEIGRIIPYDFPEIKIDGGDDSFSTHTINYGNEYADQSAGIYSMGYAYPGEWIDGGKFKTNVGYNSCVEPFGGLYELDLETMEAVLLEPITRGE